MVNPTEIIPGVLFYAYLSEGRKEKVGFFAHHTLVLLVSGSFLLETSGQRTGIETGQMMLIRKNQLGEITKMPAGGRGYESMVITLQEDLLRQIALEEQLTIRQKYTGPPNVLIPGNDFLRGFFQSVIPYVQHSEEEVTNQMGVLKVKEGVQLLLHALPELKNLMFDFSEPHKIDLERFMLHNYHFNIPLAQFARLTGRSLAAFKRDFQRTFGMPPRQWLQEKRLTEARHRIEHRRDKPSAIYLDLGFETLSHFSYAFKRRFGKTPSEWSAAQTENTGDLAAG